MMFQKVLLGGLVITLITWISDHLVILLDVSMQARIRHSHKITSKIGIGVYIVYFDHPPPIFEISFYPDIKVAVGWACRVYYLKMQY